MAKISYAMTIIRLGIDFREPRQCHRPGITCEAFRMSHIAEYDAAKHIADNGPKKLFRSRFQSSRPKRSAFIGCNHQNIQIPCPSRASDNHLIARQSQVITRQIIALDLPDTCHLGSSNLKTSRIWFSEVRWASLPFSLAYQAKVAAA